jgi:wyosine [tRNA(Phe)-imidazoG37] synthetase (radical SAM superfamily)
MSYKYLFGPVISRRLGRSLGVDLLPFKTCSLDCVYCECGKTTDLTCKRKEYVPTKAVIAELDDLLSKKPQLDYITFSGSGEPTLHSGIGKIIGFIKEKYPKYKVAVLTNSTMFGSKQARKDVLQADLLVPSFEAASIETFKRVNRPHKNISLNSMLAGLIKLRKEFKGDMWLEVFIVPGINDSPQELLKIKRAISKIKPDKVQINSLDRPGTEDWVKKPGKNELDKISKFLTSSAKAVKGFAAAKKASGYNHNAQEQILATIKRRPCTADDLSKITGISVNQVQKYLHRLVKKHTIAQKKQKRGVFYVYR